MKSYPEEVKIQVIERHNNGETVLQISRTTGISRPTIYSFNLIVEGRFDLSQYFFIFRKYRYVE